MDFPALLWLVAKFVLLLVGLVGPGAAIMRALRLPLTIATCFAGSAVALYVTVLALQIGSIRISLVSLIGGLATIIIVVRLVRGGTVAPSDSNPSLLSRAGLHYGFARMGAWTPLYLLFWAAILLRAWREPLAGPDVGFRWSYLAEQILRVGNLDFYPPRSAADFHSYFWVESIPPGVSAIYAWVYACAGTASAAWTVPVVILQFATIHALLWRTAEHIGGVRAARFTCLAAAACPLLSWSILLDQETGLTAISLVGIVFSLQGWQKNRTSNWAALLGVFAVLGATAREYGLIFPALAVAGLLLVGANRQAWIAFGAIAMLGVIWPLRVCILTGNPFYSLAVGPLPINSRFVAWIDFDAATLGRVLHTGAGWRTIARYLLLFAPPMLIGAGILVVGILRGHRSAGWALGSSFVIAGLWLMSVRFTNGGLFYSMRVLSPALALGTLACGVGLAALARPQIARAAQVILVVLFLATLPSTVALPQNPWTSRIVDWPVFKGRSENSVLDEALGIIRQHSNARPPADQPAVVIADAPGFQGHFMPAGIRVIPLWSPQADWLFDTSLSPQETATRWRDSGVRHIILTKLQTNLDFFNAHSRWARPPLQVQVVGETAQNVVFAIRAID